MASGFFLDVKTQFKFNPRTSPIRTRTQLALIVRREMRRQVRDLLLILVDLHDLKRPSPKGLLVDTMTRKCGRAT